MLAPPRTKGSKPNNSPSLSRLSLQQAQYYPTRESQLFHALILECHYMLIEDIGNDVLTEKLEECMTLLVLVK